MNLTIRFPGHPPLALGPDLPSLSVGRSPRNDVVVEDPSISRHHARLEWREGRAWVQDLGSMNGTRVNGAFVKAAVPLGARDELRLGNVHVTLEVASDLSVRIEPEDGPLPRPTLVVPAASLRESPPGLGRASLEQPSPQLVEALQLLSEVTLELLRDTSLEKHLELLMDRMCAFLKPSRAAVMLRSASGSLDPAVVRGVSEGTQILLSRTLVEAALERREALLLNDLFQDPCLGRSDSLMLSGVTSAMTTPLEYGGQVVGLLYVDARLGRNPFTREDLRLLASLAHVAAAKIQTLRLQEEVAAKRAMEQEFALAHQIQQRLLPERAPVLEGHEILGVHHPCREVSGDLFGFWPGPGGRLLFAIADVVGKGLGPGLLMASLQAYAAAWADMDLPVGELTRRLSVALARHTAPTRFVTAFLGRLDPATGEVEYASAGHPSGILLRGDGSRELLPSQGLPLAVFPGDEYPGATVRLEPGDLLVLYTDGITEAPGLGGGEFGAARLEEALAGHRAGSLDQASGQLFEAVDAFTGGMPLSDDRTLLLLRRLGA